MKNFTYRLPFLLGLLLTVVFSWLFPAKAALGVRSVIDLPTILNMPVGSLLTLLFSATVLGAVVSFVLAYLHVSPDTIPVVANILVSIIGAAAGAGMQFIPPEWLNMTVWQALIAIFSMLTALAGVRLAGLWQLAQVKNAVPIKDVTPRVGVTSVSDAREYDPVAAARALAMI